MLEQKRPETEPSLARNAVGLPTVLMQSIAQIAPALGILSTLGFNTKLAGITAPSTYMVAFAIALIVAATIAQLARHLPSAGGFFTYVSVTVGPSWGFMVGWTYSWFVAAIPGAIAAFTAFVISDELSRSYGFGVFWPVLMLAILSISTWVAYRGIRVSGAGLMISTILEVIIVLALSISGILSPGEGGLTVAGLNPLSSTSVAGFSLAVLFSIFVFTGWESAAALAEETRDPQRQIPRAIVGSVLLLGVFYVFCAWGLQLGWGIDNLDRLATTSELPAFAVAHRLWGSAWLLVLLALFNSAVAVCIACAVDSTRNWYAMARSGALPRVLAHVHPEHRTPSNAVLAQFALASLVPLGLGIAIGPDQAFFLMGLVGTLVYVVVCCLGNVGVMRYFLTARRSEFHVLKHLALPLLSSLALLAVALASLYPLPEPPVRYAPAIVAALLIAGAAALWRLHASGRTEWKVLSQHTVER